MLPYKFRRQNKATVPVRANCTKPIVWRNEKLKTPGTSPKSAPSTWAKDTTVKHVPGSQTPEQLYEGMILNSTWHEELLPIPPDSATLTVAKIAEIQRQMEQAIHDTMMYGSGLLPGTKIPIRVSEDKWMTSNMAGPLHPEVSVPKPLYDELIRRAQQAQAAPPQPEPLLSINEVERLARAGVAINFDQVKHRLAPDAKGHSPFIETDLISALFKRWVRGIEAMMQQGFEYPWEGAAFHVGDKVQVFIATKAGKTAVFEDEYALYPSDKMVANVILLLQAGG